MSTLFDKAYKQKRTWLQKNIRPLIALVILVFVLSMLGSVFIWVLTTEIETKNEGVLLLLVGTVNTFATLVLGFYFGSMERNGESAPPSGDFDDAEFDMISECPHCHKSLYE